MKVKQVKSSRIPNHCIVVYENGSWDRFHIDVVMKFTLKKGLILNDDRIKDIKKEQRKLEVKQKAFRAASAGTISRLDLIRKLKRKNFEDDEIDLALNFLDEFDLLDDKKYARKFVRSYSSRKNAGPYKIIQELLKRGIDKNIAELAVEEEYNKDQQKDAFEFARKKMKLIGRKDKAKQKNSLYGSLARAGFQKDVIRKVMHSIFNE